MPIESHPTSSPSSDAYRVASVSDQAPPDWYTDPEDDSQYRYWDGSAWTEHRAPRHTDAVEDPEPGPGEMRGPGQLISNAFSLVARHWRGCAAAAAVSAVGQAVMVVLVAVAADRILMGELGEILNRVTEPGFDADAPEHKAYFESLDLDLSARNFVPVVLGLLLVWVTSSVATVAVSRIALDDLHGRTLGASDALRQALGRVPRLMGVNIQILAVFVIAVALAMSVQGLLVFLVGPAAWLLLILLIPAFIAGAIYAGTVAALAYVAAAAGPAAWSLPYGARLVRGRFWGTLGRLLLVWLVVVAASTVVGTVLALAGAFAGPSFQLVSQLFQTAVGAALAVVGLVAPAILYHDLGGESD